MFTGIVEARGRIAGIEKTQGTLRIRIASDLNLSDLRVGDSISVDGACLTATVVDSVGREFVADVSRETIAVTTIGEMRHGSEVNIEKAMRLGARLGGHLVLGHVDCVGRVVERRASGPGFVMSFEIDSTRYLIEKGSVAVDGVSLTVNRVETNRFWVMIVPYTSLQTGLTGKSIGDKVNIEFDMIAKYIEKFVSARTSGSGLNEQTLKEYGFI
jgi:riboflavin synthase